MNREQLLTNLEESIVICNRKIQIYKILIHLNG